MGISQRLNAMQDTNSEIAAMHIRNSVLQNSIMPGRFRLRFTPIMLI